MVTIAACHSVLTTIIISELLIVKAQTEGDTGYDIYGDGDDDYYEESALASGPRFDIPQANVSVIQGQIALLPCSINYLGKFKVAWLQPDSFPMTYVEKRVTDDTRVAIVRAQTKDWNLEIRDVQSSDAGQYRCTVNTQPVLTKIVTLSVRVPPQIIAATSSGNINVAIEGSTVVLKCNATGIPEPEVVWRRAKNSDECRSFAPDTGELLHTGSRLILNNISRQCGDTYECIADNGVRSPVSRKMELIVEFAPRVSLPTPRLGQSKGRETILDCKITARPQVSNFWRRLDATSGAEEHRMQVVTSSPANGILVGELSNQQIPSNSGRHSVEVYEDGLDRDTLTLSLRISYLEDPDYGEYQCVAINNHGKDEKIMTLFEYKVPSIAVVEHPSTNITSTRSFNDHRGQVTSPPNLQMLPLHNSHHTASTSVGHTPVVVLLYVTTRTILFY